MLRLTLALLGAAAAALAFVEPTPDSAPGAAVPAAAPTALRTVEPGCKPTAPIDVVLRAPEGARAGRIPLDFEVTPRIDVKSLSWELVLPERVLAEGETRGQLTARRGEMSAASATVDLPYDGRGRAVGLRVTAVIEGSDETGATFDEVVAVDRRVVFGELETPAVKRLTRDDETGEMITVLAVPTRHRMGR